MAPLNKNPVKIINTHLWESKLSIFHKPFICMHFQSAADARRRARRRPCRTSNAREQSRCVAL